MSPADAQVAEKAPATAAPAPGLQLAPEAPVASPLSPGIHLQLRDPDVARLDPRRAGQLQRAAGNRAVASMLQRAPETRTATIGAVGGTGAEAPVKPRGGQIPLKPVGMLPDIINAVPDLIGRVDTGISNYAERMREKYGRFNWSAAKPGEEATPTASIGAVTLFAKDAIYRMAGDGAVEEVESSFEPADPKKPDAAPKLKYPMLAEGVFVLDPGTGFLWQVVLRFTKEVDEETGNTSGKLRLLRVQERVEVPKGMPKGQLVMLVYAPNNEAAKEGATLPGFKSMTLEQKPADSPPWAKKKLTRIQKLLQAPANDAGQEVRGTGQGQKGEGKGGGGSSATVEPGAKPGPVGDAQKKPGKGGKRRAKPDKVVLWEGKRGPMLNVWKGKSHEAIPINETESDQDLTERIEESAGRQVSTGETLADGAEHTGKRGGEGSAQATETEMAEATEFTANAAAYPATLAMRGGSGGEISPEGWGTTITGAFHNFDMVLDYDARNFGLANQTFARLGWIDYYWQVIDIGNISFGKDETGEKVSRTKRADEKEDAFRERLRIQAVAGAESKDRVRVVDKLDSYFAKARNETIRQGEGIKEDRPDFTTADTQFTWPAKAAAMSVMGVSAVWNIGKALISGWFAKATEPENRQELEFDRPGEFLVRCLANPHENENVPVDERTRRATSVAVFPIRVLAVNQRAREVTGQDRTDLEQAQALLALLEADLEADKENEAKQVAVEQARMDAKGKKTWYDYSTVDKIGRELADYDRQIEILQQLALQRPMSSLPDRDKDLAMQIRDDIRKRLNRGPSGFVGWFDYENHMADTKKARATKAEQKELATDKAKDVDKESTIRPRVTFVSEENGALIRMEMILGRKKGMKYGVAHWLLSDVTTEANQGTYAGISAKAGVEGDAEAISKAFETYGEKAEYGRGTIAIEIPGRPDLISPGRTILMKPGAMGRWRQRLKDLVEIAGLVTAAAPAARGAAMIGRIAEIGTLIDVGGTMLDKAAHGQLRANFETLSGVVSALAPIGKGVGALGAARMTESGKYALSVFAKGSNIASDLMMPIGFFNDLQQLVSNTEMDPAERRAAIARLFARGIKDGTVMMMSKRVGGAHEAQPGRPTTEVAAPVREPLPAQGGDAPMAAPPPVPAPAKTSERATGARPAVDPEARPAPHDQFDLSDTSHEPAIRRPRPTEAERLPTDSGEGATGAVPTTGPSRRRTQAEIDAIRPDVDVGPDGQPLPRGKDANRAEQERRAAKHATDQVSVQGGRLATGEVEQGTRPDARARARAADYLPVFNDWTTLGVDGRVARIEAIVNAHLAREGIPPAHVAFGGSKPGGAISSGSMWSIGLSKLAVEAKAQPSPNDFATLVDNAVHETQHLVTIYRGVRIALANDVYTPRADIPQRILDAAGAANERQHPEIEFHPVAVKEAFDIYKSAVDPVHDRPQPGNEAAQYRDRVIARRKETFDVLARAKAAADIAQARAERNPFDTAAQEHAIKVTNIMQQAAREANAAHNDYMSLPEETFSWRVGSAVKNAVLESLALASRLTTAQLDARTASRERAVARRKGDRAGAEDAHRRAAAADELAKQTKDQIAALQPNPQGEKPALRERPLSARELKNAPKPPLRDDAGSSSPVHAGGRQQPTQAVDNPTLAKRSEVDVPAIDPVAQTGEQPTHWRNKPIGSDLPATQVSASIGSDVVYDQRSQERYKHLGKPPGGTTDSVLYFDTLLGKQVMFKPEQGEKSIDYAQERGVEKGQLAPRAKAAEITIENLGGRLEARDRPKGIETPAVELVQIGQQRGSLTDWVAAAPGGETRIQSLQDYLYPTKATSVQEATNTFDALRADKVFYESWHNIQALDYLINNLDRLQNFGNYLIETGPKGEFKRLIPIDSELAFTATAERAIIYRKTETLENIRLSDPMLDRLLQLNQNKAAFRAQIEPLVGKQAVDGVMQRLNDLVTRGLAQRKERLQNRANAAPVEEPKVVPVSAKTAVGDD